MESATFTGMSDEIELQKIDAAIGRTKQKLLDHRAEAADLDKVIWKLECEQKKLSVQRAGISTFELKMEIETKPVKCQ
jgi:hypothetical protein